MARSRSRVIVAPSPAGHVGVVVRALTGGGWALRRAPANGQLLRNRQLVVL